MVIEIKKIGNLLITSFLIVLLLSMSVSAGFLDVLKLFFNYPNDDTFYVFKDKSKTSRDDPQPTTDEEYIKDPNKLDSTKELIQKKDKIQLEEMELNIHNLINKERESKGLSPLKWNEEVASVAREHSKNLAVENENLTSNELYCEYPFIHHEGFEFGLNQKERLNNRGIYRFGFSAENIALANIAKSKSYETYDGLGYICMIESVMPLGSTREIIEGKIKNKAELAQKSPKVKWVDIENYSQDELENVFLTTWMDSDGHRANILDEYFTEEGIGISEVNDWFIATQVFIQTGSSGGCPDDTKFCNGNCWTKCDEGKYKCTSEGAVCLVEYSNEQMGCPTDTTFCNDVCWEKCDEGVFSCTSTGGVCYVGTSNSGSNVISPLRGNEVYARIDNGQPHIDRGEDELIIVNSNSGAVRPKYPNEQEIRIVNSNEPYIDRGEPYIRVRENNGVVSPKKPGDQTVIIADDNSRVVRIKR